MAEERDKIDFRYHEIDKKYVRWLNRLYDYYIKYHEHKVYGLKNVPRKGRCIIAVNHSLATYDIGMLQYRIYKETGRYPRGLADNAFFVVPSIGKFAGKMGAVPGKHHVAEYLLEEKEEIIMIAPGGMRESLRPKEEKYKVLWENRKGFVKLAVKTRTPIILAACPKADDLYEVRDSKVTKFVYKQFKLPFPIVKGRRFLLPHRIKLEHHLSELIHPPEPKSGSQADFDAVVDRWHKELIERMDSLMQESLKLHPETQRK